MSGLDGPRRPSARKTLSALNGLGVLRSEEPQPKPATRPVRLQVNTSGAWKDVAFFDAADDPVSAEVLQGAEAIGKATNSKFRVAMRDGAQSVLLHLTAEGWKEWR